MVKLINVDACCFLHGFLFLSVLVGFHTKTFVGLASGLASILNSNSLEHMRSGTH